jgi:hypothetical protein
MRPHIVESVTALWAQMLLMRTKFAMLVAFDGIFLADEAQQAFSGQGLPNLLEYVRPFAGELHTNPLMREFNEASLDQHRLFIGDRLWLLFYIYRAFLMRNGLLISQSWERRTFVDWRKDSGVSQLLGALLTSDEVAQLKAKNAGGLAAALARIEAAFLHEATRVMSGSKAMADSLSDMQAILLLQNATIGKRS